MSYRNMVILLGNILLSAVIIGIATVLAKQFPHTAGFVVGAIPLSTALTLAITQIQYGDTEKTLALARSVFVAVLLSLGFFVPFLLGSRFRFNFWLLYVASLLIVVAMYPVHQRLSGFFK